MVLLKKRYNIYHDDNQNGMVKVGTTLASSDNIALAYAWMKYKDDEIGDIIVKKEVGDSEKPIAIRFRFSDEDGWQYFE